MQSFVWLERHSKSDKAQGSSDPIKFDWKSGFALQEMFPEFSGEGAEKASDSILIVILFIKLTIIIGTTTLGIALNYDNHSND